jgi:hypothetical protein
VLRKQEQLLAVVKEVMKVLQRKGGGIFTTFYVLAEGAGIAFVLILFAFFQFGNLRPEDLMVRAGIVGTIYQQSALHSDVGIHLGGGAGHLANNTVRGVHFIYGACRPLSEAAEEDSAQ